MLFSTLVVLVSISGVLCDPFDCFLRERQKCDESLLPKDYPSSVEEIRTACHNIDVLGRCMLDVFESCEYGLDVIDTVRKDLGYINSICDENNPINKVISANIECIAPKIDKVVNACRADLMSEELKDLINEKDLVTDKEKRSHAMACLDGFWHVSCKSTMIGLFCGADSKNAVADILKNVDKRYDICTPEMLEELEPLHEAFEIVAQMDFDLKKTIEERK